LRTATTAGSATTSARPARSASHGVAGILLPGVSRWPAAATNDAPQGMQAGRDTRVEQPSGTGGEEGRSRPMPRYAAGK
jgi:hypothetical protein